MANTQEVYVPILSLMAHIDHRKVTFEDGESIQPTEGKDEREYSCILRATDGKQTISTHVRTFQYIVVSFKLV